MAFVFARPIDAWLASFPMLAGAQSILRLLALFGVVVGIHILVSLPLSFYSGYVVEHRFKLSNQSLGRWVTNWLKRNAFGIVLGAVLYAGLYWMIWHTGNYWWLIAAGVFFLFSVILGQLAPVVFLPLFYKIERLDDPAAHRADGPARRRHRAHDRRRLPHGPVGRHREGQRDARRPRPHAPRADGRHAAWKNSRPTKSKSSSPTRSATTSIATSRR